jgi:hypothetical protein
MYVEEVKHRAACEGGYPGLFDMGGNLEEWVDGCDKDTGSADDCAVAGSSSWTGDLTPTISPAAAACSAPPATPASICSASLLARIDRGALIARPGGARLATISPAGGSALFHYVPPLHIHIAVSRKFSAGLSWAQRLERWFSGDETMYAVPSPTSPSSSGATRATGLLPTSPGPRPDRKCVGGPHRQDAGGRPALAGLGRAPVEGQARPGSIPALHGDEVLLQRRSRVSDRQRHSPGSHRRARSGRRPAVALDPFPGSLAGPSGWEQAGQALHQPRQGPSRQGERSGWRSG